MTEHWEELLRAKRSATAPAIRPDIESDKSWVLLVICLLFLAINLRWIYLFRAGQPLDIDEAGYLAISLNYYKALMDGGVGAWIASIEAPNIHAPLTMVLASLGYAIAAPDPLSASSSL